MPPGRRLPCVGDGPRRAGVADGHLTLFAVILDLECGRARSREPRNRDAECGERRHERPSVGIGAAGDDARIPAQQPQAAGGVIRSASDPQLAAVDRVAREISDDCDAAHRRPTVEPLQPPLAQRSNDEPERERDDEARQGRADPEIGRLEALDVVDPPGRAVRVEPLMSAKPASQAARSLGGRRHLEDVAAVAARGDEPVGEEDGEERDEERAEQEEEGLVGEEVDGPGRREWRRGDGDEQNLAVRARGAMFWIETAVE